MIKQLRGFGLLLAALVLWLTPPIAQAQNLLTGVGSFRVSAGVSPATETGAGTAGTTAATASYALPSGCATGNLLVVWHVDGGGSTGQAYTMTGSGAATTLVKTYGVTTGQLAMVSRVLGGSDTGLTITGSGGSGEPIQMVCFSGATVATWKDSFFDSTSATTSSFSASWTPSGSSKGVFAFMAGGGGAGQRNLTGPASWTKRLGNVAIGGIGWWDGEIWDRLSGYTNTTITWTGWGTSGFDQGDLLELT